MSIPNTNTSLRLTVSPDEWALLLKAVRAFKHHRDYRAIYERLLLEAPVGQAEHLAFERTA